MPAANALKPAERKRILALHADGMSRNDIARTVKRSSSTVTRIVHEAGGTFDRTATKAATEAKTVDASARKAQARLNELEILELMQKQILDVLNGRGAYETVMRAEVGEETRTLTFIPARDLQQLANARSSSTTIIARLDENAGEQVARSLLSGLADAFGLNDDAA